MPGGFKALSDPTRRKILELLAEEDLSAGDIAEHFSISKPSISNHLNVLKAAGLVVDERRGRNIVYHPNTTVFQELMQWLLDVTQKAESSDATTASSPQRSSHHE